MSEKSEPKKIYRSVVVDHINGYLIPGPEIYVMKRREPYFDVPEMRNGSIARDDGNFLLTPEERNELVAKNPRAVKWIRPFMGGEEFINGKLRYCLWLVDCPPDELRKMPLVYQRVQAVKNFRLSSKREGTRKAADKPMIFSERRQPKNDYLLVPQVSSEKRRYIPIGYMDANTIASNLVFVVPNANLFHFGVLTSCVHMNWVRLVCGRLTSRYRYSATICYNPFPWPLFYPESQRERIERSAQKILDTRAKYPNATYADLYDEISMPYDLRRAHEENDREVLRAYNFPPQMNELAMQLQLLEMYKTLRDEFDDEDE